MRVITAMWPEQNPRPKLSANQNYHGMRRCTRGPFKIEHRRKKERRLKFGNGFAFHHAAKRFDGCTGSNTHQQKFGIEL
jgi:hypothetical protein